MDQLKHARNLVEAGRRAGVRTLQVIGYLVHHHQREVFVVCMLAIVLAIPFVLRVAIGGHTGSSGKDERLVILSPHNATIRREFGEAFVRHMRREHDLEVYVDWRSPGGTSEIARMIDAEFEAAFELAWERRQRKDWLSTLPAFNDHRLSIPNDATSDTPAQAARRLFLDSETGIGIDLLFGGGSYDFGIQAGKGHLVAEDPEGRFGIRPLRQQQPTWFTEDIFPTSFAGEPFRDTDDRWLGTCLSSFGICFNHDSLARLGIGELPDAWEDLADPRFIGEVALADPTRSGSIAKAFEMLIQQQIALVLEQTTSGSTRAKLEISEAEVTRRARADGWRNGLRLIQKIAANARYFTDSASRIPLDVAQGNATLGMCIDFYGRAFADSTSDTPDLPRVDFITPTDGSSTGVDPIGMFRGAPRPDLAHAFMRFVLSPEGQQLWNFRAGSPGGPSRTSLRRLPVRKDLYLPQYLAHFSDPEDLPYEREDAFTYHPEWTGHCFESIRFIVRVMCVDVHDELREAWQAIIAAGMPLSALAVFEDVAMVSYPMAGGGIAELLHRRDPLAEARLARDLTDHFRGQYRRAARLARDSRLLSRRDTDTSSL